MIKLALLIPTLDRSGAEKQLSLLASNLPRDEFDVHVVALTRGGPWEELLRNCGIPVTIINKRWKSDPLALLRLKRVIREIDPDVLNTWTFTANSYGRLIAGAKPRPRVVVSERCVDVWKAGWQLWLDRRQIRRTTKLIANSGSVAEFYRRLGYQDHQVQVIPNGVVAPDRSLIQRNALPAELELPAGARIVGYVGRLSRQKRVHDLVWAMQLLRQIHENAYLVVVGDGPERQRCEEHARKYDCRKWIRFLGHRTDTDRLLPYFDVFWLGSAYEGMSNSVMEAMAWEIPVVASDIPPNRELVVDGETGYLVGVGDSPGFAQFADRILADPAMARRMGAAGRARVLKDFTVEQMVDAYAAVYRQVAAGVPDERAKFRSQN